MPRYHYPLNEVMEEQIHTPGGVRRLVEKSHLWDLLRELEKDGYEVGGAAAELAALVNYVSGVQVSMSDVQSHLDYCAELIRKQIR